MANMSDRFNGVQAVVLEKFPKACYTHCNSHCLNLVLSHACGDHSIKKTVRTVQDVINFFTSPKRTSILKQAVAASLPESRRSKLVTLCETRWVERHDAIAVFWELFPAVIYSLEDIENNECAITVGKAEGFRYRIRNIEFIANLKILESVLGYTFRLSVALQTRNVDAAHVNKKNGENRRSPTS